MKLFIRSVMFFLLPSFILNFFFLKPSKKNKNRVLNCASKRYIFIRWL